MVLQSEQKETADRPNKRIELQAGVQNSKPRLGLVTDGDIRPCFTRPALLLFSVETCGGLHESSITSLNGSLTVAVLFALSAELTALALWKQPERSCSSAPAGTD